MLFKFVAIVLVLFSILLSVVGAFKRKSNIDYRLKVCCVRLSATALAIIFQLVATVMGAYDGDWDVAVIMLVLWIMYLVIQVLGFQSLTEEKIRR